MKIQTRFTPPSFDRLLKTLTFEVISATSKISFRFPLRMSNHKLLICIIFVICGFTGFGQVSKTNSTQGSVIQGPGHLDRTFVFNSSDLGGATSLTEVELSLRLAIGNGTPCTPTSYGVHEDLNVRLVSPSNTTVDLVQDRWGYWTGNPSQLNSFHLFPAIDATVNFDDDNSPNIETLDNWKSGNYAPHNALSAFDGENPTGTWTLRISDGNSQFSPTEFICFITGTLSIHVPVGNTAPVASSVSFSGNLEVGETLLGSYVYSDSESDPENGSTYKWFRSDDNSGTNKAPISGATSQTYTLQAADANKYISFAVTPNDGTDAGSAVESSLQGVILCVYPSGSSLYTEDFESIPVSGTSFTHAVTGITFYTTDSLGVSTISNAGINSSDRFLDNLNRCLPGPGTVGSITTNGVADFYVHDFWLFPSENCYTVGTNGTIIIRGKKSGSTVFTHTVQSSDLNSNSNVNKGFTFIEMEDYECYAIDELGFEVTGSLDYIAIDDFKFTAVPVPTAVLLSTSPMLTFTSTSGLSDFIAEDGEASSQSISDIDIQIYNISDVNGTQQNSLSWRDNTFLGSNDGSYSGLTNTANAGSKGVLIKSADGSEFKLTDFEYYNWGESSSFTNTVKGYRDNAEVASTTFGGFDSNYDPITVNLGSTFNNVDEVRFYISAGGYVGDQSATNHSINNITVSSPVASPLSVSAAVDSNVICNGNSDGGATATASGGTSPYTYGWSNGGSTASINGITAGTYTVTVTDNVGATATATATVTEPAALSVSAIVDSNASCNGDADGGATASATGGTTPYAYLWSNAATTNAITGVSAGTYTVTVTDNYGCTSTSSATVTQPAVLVASTSVNQNVSCNAGTDGDLNSSAIGGTAPYTYSWSNGGTTANQSGISAGTYTVTITDNNGCTSTSSKTVTSPAALDGGEIQ